MSRLISLEPVPQTLQWEVIVPAPHLALKQLHQDVK